MAVLPLNRSGPPIPGDVQAPGILEPSDAAAYLQAAGILGTGAGTTWTFRAVPGRCANVLVTDDQGAGFLIKEGLGAQGRRTIRNEAAALAALRAGSARLAAYLPVVVPGPCERGELIVRVAPGSRDLDALVSLRGSLPEGLAMELGKALAHLHEARLGADAGITAAPSPWVFSSHRPSPLLLSQLDQTGWDAIRAIQRSAAACRRLDRAAREWRSATVVHNDVKWSNVILADGEERLRGGVRLIDFELCGLGDPAWDVGCALAEQFWHDHVYGTPDGRPVARLPDDAAEGGASAILLDAYMRTRCLDADIGWQLGMRIRSMTCARLLQRAIETPSAPETSCAITLVEHLAGCGETSMPSWDAAAG